MWNQAVSFFKRIKILGTACEFGLSLISLALSQCLSHLGLNTNINHGQSEVDLKIIISLYAFQSVGFCVHSNSYKLFLIPQSSILCCML